MCQKKNHARFLVVAVVAACAVVGYGACSRKAVSPVPAGSNAASQPQAESNGNRAAPAHAPAASVSRVKVSGRVVQTSDYCGGANPTEEMLEYLRKERPLANKQLFIREGISNTLEKPVLQTFTSDAEGNFEVSLLPGDYCVIEENKKDALKMPDVPKGKQLPGRAQKIDPKSRVVNEECLRQWWQACDKLLKVQEQNLADVVIKFHHRCNPPCVTAGPPPA